MKKKFLSVIFVLVMVLSVFGANVSAQRSGYPYMDVIDEYSQRYGVFTHRYDTVMNSEGLIFGKFIDFDKNGTDEMVLVYVDPYERKYGGGWATLVVYANKNGVLERVLKKSVYGTLGQTDVSYRVYIKDAGDRIFLSFNEKDIYSNDTRTDCITVFTMTDGNEEIYSYSSNVTEVDHFDFVLSDCRINGMPISVEEYRAKVDYLYDRNAEQSVTPGEDESYSCTYAQLSAFLDEAKNKTLPTEQKAEPVYVTLDGKVLSFDQTPLIVGDRTLVPMRAIFEALGATVEWDSVTRTVTATKGETVVTMTIDNAVISVNDKQVALDVAPQIVGDRTLAPARAVAEGFGCSVDWDANTRTVIITSK